MTTQKRDHGGGLDAAVAVFGGVRNQWLDLSTGINPNPFPLPTLSAESWNTLPDRRATNLLRSTARKFWGVPDGADVLAVPGASAAIAALPRLFESGSVDIPEPTYNEHKAGFQNAGWRVETQGDARVLVHPNNPDGKWWQAEDFANGPLTIIDESFCDIDPGQSLVRHASKPGVVVLKSFGKFWGLAGLRLGFVIAHPDTIERLRSHLGPWPVSGPALSIGTAALQDTAWASETRTQLTKSSARLDALLKEKGAPCVGGCSLFRLYEVDNAREWQVKLARGRVWSRIFPYSNTWLRLGIPPEDRWAQLEASL